MSKYITKDGRVFNFQEVVKELLNLDRRELESSPKSLPFQFFTAIKEEEDWEAIVTSFIEQNLDSFQEDEGICRLTSFLSNMSLDQKKEGNLIVMSLTQKFPQLTNILYEKLILKCDPKLEASKALSDILAEELRSNEYLQFFIEDWAFQSVGTTHQVKETFGYTPVGLTPTLAERGLQAKTDVINVILGKTHSNGASEENMELIEILDSSIHKVMDNKDLAFIINAAAQECEVLFVKQNEGTSPHGAYNVNVNSPCIVIFGIGEFINKKENTWCLTSFLIHEYLHYLIDKTFENVCLPFRQGEKEREEAINNLARKVKQKLLDGINMTEEQWQGLSPNDLCNLGKKSDEYGLLNYPEEELPSELWTFYMQEVANRCIGPTQLYESVLLSIPELQQEMADLMGALQE